MKKYLNISGKLLDTSKPMVMGILNLTPDSFYNPGKFSDADYALASAEKMISEGAHIIDIGGQSTRPGAEMISAEEEWERIKNPLKLLHERFPDTIFSIDTFYAGVAEKAVAAGAAIINDVSGGSMDSKMFETVARLKVPYILMHMKGTPQTMQQDPVYENVVKEVMDFFVERIQKLTALGVADIIIDPGFGFGKSLEHNYELLSRLSVFKMLERPVLVGISRKSMVNKVIGTKADNALNGTTVLHTVALQKGANILRVHDVKEAVEVLKLTDKISNSEFRISKE
jgi:dihydropteroate synthase